MRKITLPTEVRTSRHEKKEISALEAARNMLLQEQKGIDIEQLVQDISLGNSPLLTANVISERIGVSSKVFHQWVRNGDPNYAVPPTFEESIGKMLLGNLNSEAQQAIFPKPDLYLGDSPRWTMQTFQNWLRAEITKAR